MPRRFGTIGRWVEQGEPAADLLHVEDQLHLVTRRHLEADRLALTDLVAGGDPLHRRTGPLDSRLELVEIAGVVDLEREPVDADTGVLANREAVVIALVPTLEEDALALLVVGALADVETEHLGVVRRGEFEVRSRDVDVTQSKDSHVGRPYA